MRIGLSVLIVAASLAVGCDSRPASPPVPAAHPAADTNRLQYGWFETYNHPPRHVIVTRLTIPEVFNDKAREIEVQRYARIDAEGMPQVPPDGFGGALEIAHGHNGKGGFGYSGAISVLHDEGDGDTIVLHVSYNWTTGDQVRGKLDEKAAVKVGVPADLQLPGGCRLKVTWRAVRPS